MKQFASVLAVSLVLASAAALSADPPQATTRHAAAPKKLKQ